MRIGGFQRFSLIDYPDKICAIVFTQGCNLRCPYCHNPELVNDVITDSRKFNEREIISFLRKRKGKLDAVTITGGEPLLQTDLHEFLSRVKEMGYLVKLDTNGSLPSRLEKIANPNLIDYIAMDIKSSIEKYEDATGISIEKGKILESIRLIMDSGLDYEFRTTVVKGILSIDDFPKIGYIIKDASLYVLQKFVPPKTLDKEYMHLTPCSDTEMEYIRKMMEGFVKRCIVR